ncbi:C-glycoside deglycosidase beta subunit domain-containing protein [Novosphingobium terrae]|uniref:C-glycoside deglycosidase beta subunit domain-containing protein n=1 Tax=Novosphingobium terrae TaxID=2726189 RepID=UPI001981F299|nr:DUF6379 domain-containing protein [Novosphingobium terrae]
MPERSIIQSSGFANIGPVAARSGFAVRLRQPNYRALRLSLIEGIDITVDGEHFAAEASTILLNGRDYTHAQMAETTAIRWAVGECLSVIVPRSGGLKPGVHEVGCVLRLRHPYFPPQFQPAFVRESRHITIIR